MTKPGGPFLSAAGGGDGGGGGEGGDRFSALGPGGCRAGRPVGRSRDRRVQAEERGEGGPSRDPGGGPCSGAARAGAPALPTAGSERRGGGGGAGRDPRKSRCGRLPARARARLGRLPVFKAPPVPEGLTAVMERCAAVTIGLRPGGVGCPVAIGR